MPMTKKGSVVTSELPSTIQRSDDGAQQTFAKAHASVADQYSEARRAHQTAFSAEAPPLDITGHSSMNKDELVDAMRLKNRKESRQSRHG